jgi:SAM-dependent methyltransferase
MTINQKKYWRLAHQSGNALPNELKQVVGAYEPSSYIEMWVAWLAEHGTTLSGRMVDVGAGKGRNALYFASLGCDVYAIENSPAAVKALQRNAEAAGLEELVRPYAVSADEHWPFADEVFDFALDCFTSIDIETAHGRAGLRHELLRTMRPGAIGLVVVVSADDEFERELMAAAPGHEVHSSIWPDGKYQKNFTEKELREAYADFDILECRTVTRQAEKLGRKFTATNLWMVIKKPH